MKEYRKAKGVKEQYNSLEELRAAWGCKELVRHTKDEKKLQEQRDKFLKVCPYCQEKLNYNGGNIITCVNEKCKGKKVEKTFEDGTVKVEYFPYYRLLDDKGSDIARCLFS